LLRVNARIAIFRIAKKSILPQYAIAKIATRPKVHHCGFSR
jgi:hypothetical protein